MPPVEENFVISIDDFSPGIYSDEHASHNGLIAVGMSIPRNGAATVENTYRCHTDIGGALMPLPARVTRFNEAILPLGPGHSGNYFSGYEESYMLDMKVCFAQTDTAINAAGHVTGNPPIVDNDNDECIVFIQHAFWYNGGVTGMCLRFITRSYLECDVGIASTPTAQDVYYYRTFTYDANVSPPTLHQLVLPSGNLAHTVTYLPGQSPATPFVVPTQAMMAFMFVDPFGLLNNVLGLGGLLLQADDITYTTYDTWASTSFVSDGYKSISAACTYAGAGGGAPVIFPLTDMNTTAGFTGRPGGVKGPLDRYGEYLVAHQGRLVTIAPRRSPFNKHSSFGGDTLQFNYYPTFNCWTGSTTLPDIAGQLIAFAENPSAFGVAASLNGQDLLIIHHYGGGGVISGSLNNPTVTSMPNLHSTYGIRSTGTPSPLGYVYGGRYGVYVYNAGQTQSISPQLNGFFWDYIKEMGVGGNISGGRRQDGNYGRFAWWEPFICAPNNYIYDSRTNSWWRLEKPSSIQEPYMAYDVSPAPGVTSGKLYAMPWRKTNNSIITYDRYDRNSLATSYSWQSQPLLETRDHLVSPQEIEVTSLPAPGGSLAQLTFTLTGIDEDGNQLTPFVTTVNLNAANPRPQRDTIQVSNFSAYSIQLRIEATATGTGAPKVLPGLKINCTPRGRVVRT